MNTETSTSINARIEALRRDFKALFEEIRSLNPIINEYGKYLNLELCAHGYDDPSTYLRVYFGSAISLSDITTIEQVEQAVAEYDPEKRRAKEIEALRAKLAQLESEVAA